MNKFKLFFLWVSVGSCVANIALADHLTAPPKWIGGDTFDANTRIGPASRLRMGKIEITLEETRLEEVMGKIGNGQILHQGDAAESLAWLCYTISISPRTQRIWLTSSEMGGGIYINGVVGLSFPRSNVIPDDCPELQREYLPVGFDNRIWLDTIDTKLLGEMGSPKKNKNILSYFYSTKRDGFDINESLLVKIEKGRVVEIFVNKVTSN